MILKLSISRVPTSVEVSTAVIRTLLTGVATEFVEYSDGEDAVAAYDVERPDWAVMDVAMRVMDGLTATRLITSRFPESQILVVTQHNHQKLRECAQEACAGGFLCKEDLTGLRSLLTVAESHHKETGATHAENGLFEPPKKGEEL